MKDLFVLLWDMKTVAVSQILELADAFALHRSLSHWRVSFLLRGDGQFLQRLRNGAGCTVRTAEGSVSWFDQNWPTDLEWPKGIDRPSDKRRVG